MERRAALGQMSWPELSEAPESSEATVTLLVPLGATEQHGPHLPLDTDTRIAQAVAERVAALDHRSANGPATRVLTAPALNYGASGEHEGFPGTISLGHDALELLLLEFGRSACRWADRLLFVNGHGGNAGTLATAVRRLRYEGRDAAWFPCAFPAADAHAGHTETSVLLHFSPSAVTVSAAQAGNTAPVEALLPAMRTGGVAAVSANGVLGDPTGASGDHGAQLLDALVASLGVALGDWRVGESGRLG